MAARLLDGAAAARDVRAEIGREVAELRARGVVPRLRVVLAGDDPASAVYVRNKARASAEVGIDSEVLRFSGDVTEAELLGVVAELAADPDVDGILVQLPLPRGVDPDRVLLAVDPDKDVDGFHPLNLGRLVVGAPGPRPCTPAGILELLRRNEVPLAGARAVVIGRSRIVGKPMALLLLAEHATVTVCHTRTRDLPAVAATAELLVVAAGRPAVVDRRYLRPGATVVDVGMNRIEDAARVRELFAHDPDRIARFERRGSALVGDVHPGAARELAGAVTPVPGGVGPLTVAMLLRNTVDLARRRRGV